MKPYYEKTFNRTALLGVLVLVALLVATGAAWAQDQCIAPGQLETLGLVGWWPGDGDTTDIGGAVNDDGTNEGDVPFVDGHDNQAFEFSGTSGQSVTVAEPSDELMPTSVTVDAWVKFDGLGHARYIVGKGGLYCTHASYAIYTADAACGGSLAFYVARNGLTQNNQTAPLISTDGDNGAIVCASADISLSGLNLVGDGQYHFVTGTYDEITGVAKLYIDGVKVGDSDTNGGDYPTQNTPLPIYDVSQSVNGSTLYTLWDDTTTPTNDSPNDPGPIELGVRFQAYVDGFVHGVRFYKGPQNPGGNVGSLWDSSGNLLARANFTSETPSGWQQVLFAAPVAVTANTTYIASYFAPQGGYAFDSGYFATSSWDRLPLTALAVSNGVFYYDGTGTGFPNNTFNATNYWVDLLFSTEAGSDDLTIGSYAEANACIPVGLPFNGDVDEVEIFNRALSDGSDDPADNEIWDLYTKGKCKDGGVEPSIVKEKLSGPDMVGIYTTSATEFSFEITYTNDVQEFAVRILDTVPAEFAVFSLTKTDGTASSFATGKGNKSSATRIEWDIPADTDCSAGCTLTVAVETVPSSGGRGIYKPTSCGTLSLNNGATAYEVDPSTLEIKLEMNLVSGILEPVIVLGPSNPLEVEAVGDPADGATKPCAPENLTATLDGNNIALDWDDNAEADAIAHYNVYRSIDGARFRVVEMVQQSMYADTNLQPGEYCYQVKAEFFDGSEGNEAGEICETIPEPVL